jgi:hypothetical protein
VKWSAKTLAAELFQGLRGAPRISNRKSCAEQQGSQEPPRSTFHKASNAATCSLVTIGMRSVSFPTSSARCFLTDFYLNVKEEHARNEVICSPPSRCHEKNDGQGSQSISGPYS